MSCVRVELLSGMAEGRDRWGCDGMELWKQRVKERKGGREEAGEMGERNSKKQSAEKKD